MKCSALARVLLALVTVCAFGGSGSASAAVTGAYNPATDTLTVAITQSGDVATLRRDGTAIRLNGAAIAGSPTVLNTDLISLTDVASVDAIAVIDLRGGPFAPGEDEGGTGEIEWTEGLGDGHDRLGVILPDGGAQLALGSGGLNLDSAEGGFVDTELPNLADTIACGAGADHHETDAADSVAIDCEQASQPPPAGGRPAVSLHAPTAIVRRRRATLTITCSGAACHGTASLRRRGRAPRRAIAHVTVRGGATLQTRLRLRVRAARAVTTRARRARFRATIEGTQTVRWSVDTTDTHPACGETRYGSGQEVIRFRSARPQRLTVRPGRRGVPIFVMGRRWAQLDTRGRVSRTGSLTDVPHPSGVPCGGGAPGGDPTPPPVSDCGTKRFSHLPVIPVPLDRNTLRIDVGDPAPLPPFTHCPVYGDAFPQLLDAGRTRLPAAELFDPEIGKEIVLGGGHRRESAAGITVDARLTWTLTLERIRRP